MRVVTIAALGAIGALSACARTMTRPAADIPVEQRAQALTAVINMRRQLFGPESPANPCDVYRLLDRTPAFRELIREDARARIGPGDVRTCGTSAAPRGSWRIVGIHPIRRGFRVRVSTTNGAEAFHEDYFVRGFGVTEVRIHNFVYD
jgi:hypothetical protein